MKLVRVRRRNGSSYLAWVIETNPRGPTQPRRIEALRAQYRAIVVMQTRASPQIDLYLKGVLKGMRRSFRTLYPYEPPLDSAKPNPRDYAIASDDEDDPGPFCGAPTPPPYHLKCRRKPLLHSGPHIALDRRGRRTGGVSWEEHFAIVY